MTHQQLVIEVSEQIKLFKPDTKLIKNRIEDLIWREVRGTLRDLAILAFLNRTRLVCDDDSTPNSLCCVFGSTLNETRTTLECTNT